MLFRLRTPDVHCDCVFFVILSVVVAGRGLEGLFDPRKYKYAHVLKRVGAFAPGSDTTRHSERAAGTAGELTTLSALLCVLITATSTRHALFSPSSLSPLATSLSLSSLFLSFHPSPSSRVHHAYFLRNPQLLFF